MAATFRMAIIGTTTVLVTAAAAQPVLKSEPPMGKLKLGQQVFVDDGRCPPGQIMLVTGGDHVLAGGTKRIERNRRCVARKK